LNDYMSAVKNAMVLDAWIDEKTEDEILEMNNTAPGILKRKIDTADWLLYAMEELAKILGKKEDYAEAKELRTRVKYGVKEELLTLVRFKGIGRVRARKLMDSGVKGAKEIRAAEHEKLASLIGASAAKKLKEQIGHGQASAD
jgi:helicase